MRYHNITHDDMLNGDGLRVVLWVAGCTHHCPECQNPITWDIEGGVPFDEVAHDEVIWKRTIFLELRLAAVIHYIRKIELTWKGS